MPNTGGKNARHRRTQRRRAKRAKATYGPILHVPIRYYGTHLLTDYYPTGSYSYGKHVAMGNRELFSGDFTALKAYSEYKILKAQIKITWTCYKLKQWSIDGHPDAIAVSTCSFIRDQDAELKFNTTSVPFDRICSTLGAKTSHVPAYSKSVTRHIWTPTEPTDSDWRQTDNDGLCHLYLFWRSDDLVNKSHAVSATVEITTRVKLRSFNVGQFKTAIHPAELNEIDLHHHAAAEASQSHDLANRGFNCIPSEEEEEFVFKRLQSLELSNPSEEDEVAHPRDGVSEKTHAV